MVQFEKSATVTAYEEPRAANIWLIPERSNLITNPSFENGTTHWSARNESDFTDTVSTSSWSGTHVATLTADGTGETGIDFMGVAVGAEQGFNGSIYIKDFNTSKQYQAVLTFYDEDSLAIGESVGELTTVSSGHWTRVGVNGTSPVGTTGVWLTVISDGTPAAGTSVYFDAAQLSQGSRLTTYLDGSKDSRGCAWEGTAHDSISHYYSNRDSKLTRLAATINTMLPLGTPFYIDCYGIENVSGVFSGISQ
jgi:hypothetical protein